MQRTLPLILVAVLALGVAGILTRSRPTPELQAARTAYQMLDLPLNGPAASAASVDGTPAATPAPQVLFWRAFLEAAVELPGAPGQRPVLRLGELRADPQSARLSADCAGELLALPARTAFGLEPDDGAPPLWKALLDGPAAERDPESGGLRVRLHGCRHSADPAFHPVIEESYYARLSVARALADLAAPFPEYQPLVVEGIETPCANDLASLNFEVQLMGPIQAVTVTANAAETPALFAQRPWSAAPPNDETARRSLIEGLRQRAGTDPAYAELHIEGDLVPAPGGVDLRLEYFGENQTLTAKLRDGRTLQVTRAWIP